MNEYLEAEKEAGTCEAAERVTRITEEHSVRKSRQVMAKRAHPSSSVNGLTQKMARREPEAKVCCKELLSQGWAQENPR